MNLNHPIRLGILKERSYLVQHFTATYSALLCNANLIVTFGGGVGNLLRQSVGKGSVSGFLVDPMTHILNVSRKAIIDSTKKEIKPGIRKLLDKYEVPDSIVKTLPLDVAKYGEKIINTTFVSAVLDFQKKAVRETAKEDKEYIEFADSANVPLTSFDPGIIIAPYLFINDDSQDASITLQINKKLFLVAQRLEGQKVCAYLMIHQSALSNPDFRNSIITIYKELSPKALFLWITRLSEHEPTGNSFQDARALVMGLVAENIPIVRVYGSFYSYTLREENLIGVVHGPGYGEERNEIPVGGGLPRPKFYLPRLHKRIDFTDAEIYLKQIGVTSYQQYYNEICNCPACREIIGQNLDNFRLFGKVLTTTKRQYDPKTKRTKEVLIEYASPDSVKLTTNHYMYSKYDEINNIQELSRAQVQEMLRQSYRHFEVTPLKSEAAHLLLWAE
jgi:hypothetical protein